MVTLFSHALEVLSRLFFTLRSACSLRRLVVLLPVGKAAPRLNIHWSDGQIRGLWQHLSGDAPSATDELYTTSTCVSDFDGECAPCDLHKALSSNWIHRHLPPAELAARKSKLNNHREKCQSDHGLAVHLRAHAPARRMRSRCSSRDCVHHYVCPTMGSAPSVILPPKVPAQKKRDDNSTQSRRAKKFRRQFQSSVRSYAPSSAASSKPHSAHFDQASESGGSSSFDSDVALDSPCFHRSCDAKRINQLEMEMYQLRSQLARLLLVQEGKQLLAASSEECDQRLEGDGESDAGPVDIRDTELSHPAVSVTSETSENSQIPIVLPSSALPPPPPPPPLPPPPPPSPSARFDWRADLIAAKKKKYGTDPGGCTQKAKTPLKAADMGQVLRELQSGAIKLRAVPRSPGGTPVRSNQSPKSNDTDPCSIIARALKNKFGGARAVLNVSSSGGENTQESSFCESPHVSAVTTSVNGTDGIVPFGQHLLRPTAKHNREI